MSTGCPYANRCQLFKNIHNLLPSAKRGIVEQLCNNTDCAHRCMRAKYHAVYGDDPDMSYAPLSSGLGHQVWFYQPPAAQPLHAAGDQGMSSAA